MKAIKTCLALSTAVLLSSALLLSACSGNEPKESISSTPPTSETASPTAGSKIDNSKEVKIVGYLLGDAPKGMPEVLAQVNAKLKKDVNAIVELNYIGWGDVASKYPLVLASGNNVDFIFAADWNYYVSESTKGAFMLLEENMIKTYMPKYYAKQDPSAYKAAQIEGKQYMIPTTTPDRKVNVMALRKDIMEKAGLTNVTKISELEPYFAAIKKNNPEMIPLNLDSQYDLPTPFINLMTEKFSFQGAPLDSGDPMAVGIYTDWEDPSGKLYSLTEEPVKGAFQYAAETMKKWYDAGYVNKNPYSNKTRSKDNFANGKSGVAFGNSLDIQATLAASKANGIDTYLISVVSPTGHSYANSWLNNGVAIAASSKNPERTLQVLDLLMQDQSYADLVTYGIEGKNYAITTDGKVTLPKGVTAETNTFPQDASGFWFVNKDFLKVNADWSENYIEHIDKVKKILKPMTYGSFTFNSEKVKSEIANMKNVSAQYFLPLAIGAFKEYDKSFDNLVSKLQSAGVDKVKAELEAQTSAYLKKQGK